MPPPLRWSCIALACWLAPAAAQAQDLPKGSQDAASASTGKTEITSDKAVAIERGESKDANELSLQLGGLQSGGNARLFAVTGAGKYRLRRGSDQFRAALAGNYARAALPNQGWDTTVQNEQGLARYDRFLGDFTLFLAGQGRRDQFQGLDLRAQLDPGVGYYFVNQKHQLLWIEVGYDLLHDIRREEDRVTLDAQKRPVLDASGQPVLQDKTRTLHSARLFLGYEHALNEASKLTAGVEFLQGLSDTSIYRLNSDIALTTKILGALAFSFAMTERYESKPLQGKQTLDTTSSASLVYTFL